MHADIKRKHMLREACLERFKTEQIHQTLTPEVVRNIGQCARVLPPTFLSQLGDAVLSAGLNVPVEICKLLPTDRKRKYE